MSSTEITDPGASCPSTAQQEKAPHKAERDREVMMRALSRGDALLWDNPIGWDVLVLCGPFLWRLHQHILGQCAYFAARMTPWLSGTDEGQTVVGLQDVSRQKLRILPLSNHGPGQLANVLRFLYVHDYPGSLYCQNEPLNADCLLTNTAMFIAAASVACHPMMAYASDSIIRYTSFLRTHLILTVVYDAASIDYKFLQLAVPLRKALTILYEQPLEVLSLNGDNDRDGESHGILWPLRWMLAKFAAEVLPLLAASPAFHSHYSIEWHDQMFFQHLKADVANLVQEEMRDRTSKGGETQLSRASAALSLLQQLARTEQE